MLQEMENKTVNYVKETKKIPSIFSWKFNSSRILQQLS